MPNTRRPASDGRSVITTHAANVLRAHLAGETKTLYQTGKSRLVLLAIIRNQNQNRETDELPLLDLRKYTAMLTETRFTTYYINGYLGAR